MARARRVIALVGGVAALAVSGCGDDDADDGRGTVPAEWEVDPEVPLAPNDRAIPILVHENDCASGRSPEGRIVVDVKYREDSVAVDVRIRPLGGSQDCPGNPTVPFLVELDEPLDGRRITGERPIQE